MEKITRLTSEQRADFVAYLDGELDDATAQTIEKTLAANSVARHEVEMLTRTWELLDQLPRAAATEGFAARTLTNISVEESRPHEAAQVFYERARKGCISILWTATLAAGAFVGFLTTNRWIPVESDVLINDIEVIDDFELYSEIEDFEFLRKLRSSGLFDEPSEENDEL